MHLTKALLLLTDARDVGLAGDVPQLDVLVHAAGDTAALLGGHGGAGGGNAGIEAVFVDFLKWQNGISMEKYEGDSLGIEESE